MSPSVSLRLLLTQSDARLVELARAGHERAFEALVARYRRPLLNHCRRLLLPHERAEDALQHGLLQAWLALRDGAEVHDVKPWLYRVVHNSALNALRRSGYNHAELTEALSGAGAPTEDLDRRIAVRETLAGLAALPEMQREALLATAVDGSSYQEAAATLGLSEPALRGLVHRARTTLRAASTALTPAPLLSWALGSGATDAPLASRIVEVGAGGGTAGLAGLMLKAGATAAVTAGVLVGGVASNHPRPGLGAHHHAAVMVPATSGRVADAASESLASSAIGTSDSSAGRLGPRAGAVPGRGRRAGRGEHRPGRAHAGGPSAGTHLPASRQDALLTGPTLPASHQGNGKGDRENLGGGHDGHSHTEVLPGSSSGDGGASSSSSNGGGGGGGGHDSSGGSTATGGSSGGGQDSSGAGSHDGGATGSGTGSGSSAGGGDGSSPGGGAGGSGDSEGGGGDAATSPEGRGSDGASGNAPTAPAAPKTTPTSPTTTGEAPPSGD